MARLRRATAAIFVTASVVSLASATPAAVAERPRPGAVGAGDPYFPRMGNGGYQATHYQLRIAYDPATRRLSGQAVITARATAALSRFDLDLRRWLRVASVSVDGEQAEFAQPARLGPELVIRPQQPLRSGQRFTVRVRYAGPARHLKDPDGLPDGWIVTDDGAFVGDEPQGAPTWFPVNDTPDDKATYAVTVLVPRGLVAMSNGVLTSVVRRPKTTVWSWALRTPVSSYLITATLGPFLLHRGVTPDGVRYLTATDPRLTAAALGPTGKLPAILDFFSSVYGRYPFGRAGVIVDYAPFRVGYALETATRPEFDRPPDEATLAHELAHQWFGDSVTCARWRDIWLNEGFAEFSTWLWDGHSGGTSAAAHLRALLSNGPGWPGWNPPPGNPGSSRHMFDYSVYERGAGTLQALREKIGDATFFRIMRGWAARHRYGNARVGQFTAYAQAVSGRDLRRFFYRWLYRPGKP
jgi:aminopeptidase N